MDQEKLFEVVTKEAKQEAEDILNKARALSEKELADEKEKINRYKEDRLASEKNLFLSRINYLRFSMESEYKKKLLYLKHQLMEELKDSLFKTALEQISRDAYGYLSFALKDCPSKEGVLYAGNKISSFMDEKLIKQYNQEHKTNFQWGGTEASLEAGLSLEKGAVKYIFPLMEWIDRFIENKKNDINEKYYT